MKRIFSARNRKKQVLKDIFFFSFSFFGERFKDRIALILGDGNIAHLMISECAAQSFSWAAKVKQKKSKCFPSDGARPPVLIFASYACSLFLGLYIIVPV